MMHFSRRATSQLIVMAMVAVALTTVARGQSEKWYPSRWGADDQRGAANRITPAKVLQAKALITEGRIYQLGRVYEASMPLPVTRHFSLHIPQAYVLGGKNQAVYFDDALSTEIGQIGTQFDGLGHFGQGELFYNGNRRTDFAQPGGLTRLGIENVGPIFTRGVLIDVAGLRGVAELEGGYEITVADLKSALARQRVTLGAGDVVLIHTGSGALWMKDKARFTGNAPAPGIGVAAAQFLVDSEVAVVGADTSGIEVNPNPDKELVAPVHQLLITHNGIYLHENVITEDLARDGVYEFAYIFSPLRLKGATGSPGNPIAVR
jgi:kynurenine formamidase